MAQILTFLGKGGTGRSTIAIATARKLAQAGQRVLLAIQDPSPIPAQRLGQKLSTTPQVVSANLQAVQFQTPELMARLWDEEVKEREAQYLRFPILQGVYGQELGILPGMDVALALYTIRNYNATGAYDVIVYDGSGDLTTIRTLGIPETGSWYLRRFRKLILESDLGRAIAPFVQPITSAIFNFTWSWDNFADQPTQEAGDLLAEGTNAIADPKRVLAYLVTSADPSAVAIAQYYWGSAQQMGLSIGGVIWNQAEPTAAQTAAFAPLVNVAIPTINAEDTPIQQALPDFAQVDHIPKPLIVDERAQQVKVFLPGFEKNQVKLTQYGPELTIEAGDQRRNIFLPPSLKGKPVKGAKFQEHYLIISL